MVFFFHVANCAKVTKDIKYNAFGPDIVVETGKVVGQNSTRLAGNVIVGISAAFLVWDVIGKRQKHALKNNTRVARS